MLRGSQGGARATVLLLALLLVTVGCLGSSTEAGQDPADPTSVPLTDQGGDPGDQSPSTPEPGGSAYGTSPEEGPGLTTTRSNDCMAVVGTVDLHHATMADLQAAMEAGHISAVDLVDAYTERFEAYDQAGPGLNSIQVLNPEAREQAAALDQERATQGPRGPLHGMPVLLKDNIGTTAMATTAGSIALAENVPSSQATITAKLEAAGAIILGKAQLSEFANWVSLTMPNGYSSLGGQVINAYTLQDPSGSSSGPGVAGSMALAAGTVGTETSGSILSPSNANSMVGVKPTLGLTSRAGIIPLAHNFDVPGPMTRHVHDAAAMLSAMAGPDPKDPATNESREHLPPDGDYTRLLDEGALVGARVGYDGDAGGERLNSSLAVLEALGAELVPFDPGDERLVSLTEIGLIPNEFKFGINRYLAEEASEDVPVDTLTEIILFNQEHPDKVKYGQDLLIASDATPGSREVADVAAVAAIEGTRLVVDGWFEEHDLDAIVGLNAPYTSQGAAAGYPTVTVPAGYEEEDPVGLSFFGQAWSEDRLLAYAFAYEQATGLREPPTEINEALLDGVCNDEDPVEVTWPGEGGLLPVAQVAQALAGQGLPSP